MIRNEEAVEGATEMQVVMQVTTILLLAFLMIFGYFIQRSTIAKWPMFTRMSCLWLDLVGTKEGESRRIDVHTLTPSHAPFITPRQLGLILQFLNARYEGLDGDGHFFGERESFAIHVRGGHVDP